MAVPSLAAMAALTLFQHPEHQPENVSLAPGTAIEDILRRELHGGPCGQTGHWVLGWTWFGMGCLRGIVPWEVRFRSPNFEVVPSCEFLI